MKPSANTAAAKSAGRGVPKPKSTRKSSVRHETSVRHKTNERATVRKVRSAGTAPAPIPATPVPGQSKKAAVIVLLRRPEGATVAEVVAATDWQPHTVRGLFSGTLKKKLGLTLSSAHHCRHPPSAPPAQYSALRHSQARGDRGGTPRRSSQAPAG